MDPEGNRHHSALNGNPRPSDARHTYSNMPHAHSQMLSFYNYLLPPMGSMMYSPFVNPNLSWPSSNYFPHPSNWRDPSFPILNFPPDMNAARNFYINQNSRVIPREMRQKPQTKVINLESDEEEQKQKIVLVHPINNTHKASQKQAQVIQIDKISQQKSQKVQIVPVVSKLDLTVKIRKPQPTLEKVFLQSELKKKQKQLVLENKTKQITKLKNKQPKPIEKQQKLEKLQKQRKRKIIQTQKVRLKEEKQKQIQKTEKKKTQKMEKLQKIDKNDKNERNQKIQKNQKQKNEKNDKNDKNRTKQAAGQNKPKVEEGHTKQIAKYMESHGQIRHGKEFQSDIPASRVYNTLQFNKWLQQKKRNLLKRQIGALTY